VTGGFAPRPSMAFGSWRLCPQPKPLLRIPDYVTGLRPHEAMNWREND